MSGLTVIATVSKVFAQSKAEDKRPYAFLDVNLGGYVNLWPKADSKEAVKTFKNAKLTEGKTYVFENVALHNSNVVIYGATKITEV